MKPTTAIVGFGLFLFTLTGCSSGEKNISLKFRYETGQKLEYSQISKNHIKVIENDSVTKEYNTVYTVAINQEIKAKVNDSTYELFEKDVWRYPETNKEDSTKTDTVEFVQEMLLHILPNGSIVNFQFINTKDPSRIAYLRNYYEQGMPVFPNREVYPGYSWTQSTKVVLLDETMEASTAYSVKSIVREAGYDCALIEYEGNMLIPVEASPEDTTNRKGLDHITSTGMLYFAYKEGFVVKQRESWKINGERTRLKNGQTVAYRLETSYDVDFLLTRIEKI